MAEARAGRPAKAKHRLLLELGRGGMGTVYLAATDDGALVVVKQLRADIASRPTYVQSFLDEADLSARLVHPNVVRSRGVTFDGAYYFLEMEYLAGQTFEAICREAAALGGALDLGTGLFVLEEVLAGLAYAHDLADDDGRPLAIVHRDVTPHNVMVTYDGAVKVLDFGIAKASTSSQDTSTGVVKGKLAYMAPEQAARRPVDRRADVFAVGVMLWQLLTGKRMWADTPEPLIFHKLDRGEIDPPRAVAPAVPEALDAVCRKALALDPAGRFATAHDMREALHAARVASGGAEAEADALRSTMKALFGARRAADEAQIADILAGKRGGVEAVPIIGVARAPLVDAEGTGATRTVDRLAQPAATPPPRRRPWARAVPIAVMLGAAAIGAGVMASRSRSPPATVATAKRCRTNAECARQNGGAASICRKNGEICAPVGTGACRVLAEPGDAENDDTIWIGTMFPMSGDDAAAFGEESVHAADLARRDFAGIAHGIPSWHDASPSRPLAIVACDDARDPQAVAAHLVSDLGVPAIVGFHDSQEVIDLALELFLPRDVLAVATQNRSALITGIPTTQGKPRLVFRTTTSNTQSARPMSAVVSEVLEPALRAHGGGGGLLPREPLRVAHLTANNTAGLTMNDALMSVLRFNGKSAVDNGAAYRQMLFSVAPAAERAGADAALVAELLAFRPHVILTPGFDFNATTVLGPLEERWPTSESLRPRYVIGGYMLGDDFFRVASRTDELRRRFIAVNPPTRTLPNAELTQRYNADFSPKVAESASPGAVYDAVYLVAYAAYAAGEQPLGGAVLARAIGRLVPGAPIAVGPARIFDAFARIRRGEQIDLDGAASRLDFDMGTGDTGADFALSCIAAPSADGPARALETKVIYRASSTRLEELPFSCP